MTRFPPPHRIVIGLFLASAVAAWPTCFAIPMAISAGPAALWPIAIGFLVALAHALLLGLPAYLLVAWRGAPTRNVAMLAGAIIGALPVTVLTLASDGPTFVLPAILFGFCGCLGGAAFEFMISREDPA